MYQGLGTLGIVAIALAAAPTLAAQGQADLSAAAEGARAAIQQLAPASLVGDSGPILVQLPGAEPSAPVGRAQAVALLRGFLRGTDPVATSIRSARAVTDRSGYVELTRRFRVRGTEEVREQRVLLSYRRTGDRWRLVELRVSS